MTLADARAHHSPLLPPVRRATVSNKIVILDRDGVINEDSPDYIRSAGDWRPIAGSLAALARLNRSGWTVVVATNQSGVGRGYFSIAQLQAIHATMCAAVDAAGGHISAIAYCPHPPDAGCRCRKPAPGLIEDLERQLGRSLAGAPFIGDRLSDLEAARRHGCLPILVRTGRGRETERCASGVGDVFDDLEEAVAWLVRP